MDESARQGAQERLVTVAARLKEAAEECDDDAGLLRLLGVIANVRDDLDSVTVSLLSSHLQDRLMSQDLASEDVVEEIRTCLARFFDVL